MAIVHSTTACYVMTWNVLRVHTCIMLLSCQLCWKKESFRKVVKMWGRQTRLKILLVVIYNDVETRHEFLLKISVKLRKNRWILKMMDWKIIGKSIENNSSRMLGRKTDNCVRITFCLFVCLWSVWTEDRNPLPVQAFLAEYYLRLMNFFYLHLQDVGNRVTLKP
jgi:hypothetical protein